MQALLLGAARLARVVSAATMLRLFVVMLQLCSVSALGARCLARCWLTPHPLTPTPPLRRQQPGQPAQAGLEFRLSPALTGR